MYLLHVADFVRYQYLIKTSLTPPGKHLNGSRKRKPSDERLKNQHNQLGSATVAESWKNLNHHHQAQMVGEFVALGTLISPPGWTQSNISGTA